MNFNNKIIWITGASSGIGKRSIGIELGAEAQVTPTIKLKGALALGETVYTSNPNIVLTAVGDDGPITSLPEVASLKDYKVAGGPQRAASIGFEYRDPKYWFRSYSKLLFKCVFRCSCYY